MKVLLASNNAHKLREIKDILGDYFDIVTLKEAGIESDPEETGSTFEENAYIKAYAGAVAGNMPCLADDSGLEVFALDLQPGVYSARYSGEHGDDKANNRKLLAEMSDKTDRRARYVCVICLAYPDGRKIQARGECFGTVGFEEKGSGGFGYDPLFYVPELGCTFAETTAEQKNKISHRANALKAFGNIWEKENKQ